MLLTVEQQSAQNQALLKLWGTIVETKTEQHPACSVQLAIHRAVRRDLARLSKALESGEPPTAGPIRAYWADFAGKLHHHHELEDGLIWPLLAERTGGRADALLAVNTQ